MPPRRPLAFLIDDGVPDSIVRLFAARGHTLYATRDLLPAAAPDALVAAMAEEIGAALVTWHYPSGRPSATPPAGPSPLDRPGLSWIDLRCEPLGARRRVDEHLPAIEAGYRRARRNGRRYAATLVERTESVLRTGD